MKSRFAVSHKSRSKFEVKMQPGTCFYQPPGIRHREISHSKDLELLEIVAPADFRTFSDPKDRPSRLEKPSARKSRARRSRG